VTLNELRYAVAVARERHFGRAAEACHISQPSLSVAVRKLEEELGVTLFERGHGEVTLTPAGEALLRQARRVLDEVGALREMAVRQQDQLSGPLRMGAIYTIAPYLLPELIPVLHERAPEMPLVIEENYTARLRDRLKEGELDAIVVSLPFEEPGVVTLPLYDEPFVAVLPAAHPLNREGPLILDQMGDATLLLLGAGHCFRDQVLELCPGCLRSATADGSVSRNLQGSSLETIRHMVASGMGVTILPCTAAGADRYAQRLLAVRRFAEPVPSRRVALAWRASFPRPQAIEALRRAVLDTGLSCVRFIQPGQRSAAE
jgi:LysR family transcriptional regulator, hydrogen peroxide-inducible genes activator